MSFSTARPSARLRAALFTSAALASLTIANAAHAQAAANTDKLSAVYLEARGSGGAATVGGSLPTDAYLAAQGNANGVTIDPVEPTPQIVVSNPRTPNSTPPLETTNITGIGQMVVNNYGGTLSLCTATLINPRTVLFAAHCVNSRSATAYGANSGGTPISFGFQADNGLAAAYWYNATFSDGSPNPAFNVTTKSRALYNSNFVAYNKLSLEPAAQTFLYGDVAIASLDTPAAGIPTWALLFSPLPVPTSITKDGTGYNVGIDGYGGIGTGQTGQTGGSDFRRRAAENVLGALTDLDTFRGFIYGTAPSGLSQNLYFIDFDDPRRGVSGASPFDFNSFRDNARRDANGNATEGITAPGDSGGPLILQNFAKQLVIGTLSGGYARFFGSQPSYGYGAVSFFQPLYLYWDWISANNPYHYVTATGGNGSWTDATHWVSTLDPAYNILLGGQVVNGIPTVPGEQKNGTSGSFGQICEQGPSAISSASFSDCYDVSTGMEKYDPSGHPIGTATNQPDIVTIGGTSVGKADLIDTLAPQDAQATATATLPTATLANGLPGATNFVPNNADPVRTAGTAPRYFDVTLAATGTTTLSGANITIDRLTIGTAGAALVIDNGASLSTLINTTQFAGMVTVNGTLTSTGDYSLMAGALLGSGRINAPFLTSLLGQFVPGTQTTIGTMTIGGNLVMTSGTQYFVNLGGSATSDRIAVVANGASTGMATVAGTAIFTPDANVRFGDTYTILTAAGGVTGTFSAGSAISVILKPTFTYSANAVQVQVAANTYASVVGNTAVQNSFAQLLDQNRATNYAALAGLYGVLDLQTQGSIQSTLESWAPRSVTLSDAISRVAVDNMSRFYDERVGMLGNSNTGGTVAMIGQPFSVLASATTPGVATAGLSAQGSNEATAVAPAKLPANVSAYIAGGYLRGDAAPMPTAVPLGGRNDFDGYYLAAGIETDLGNGSGIGFSGSYTHLDGSTLNGEAKTGLVQFTAYGKVRLGGATIDGQVGIGSLRAQTSRTATLGGITYTLRSGSHPFVINGEIGLSGNFDIGSVRVAPRAAFRAASIGLTDTQEYGGGPMALRISREPLHSYEGRFGLTIDGGKKVHPYLSGYYVHDFAEGNATFGANFAGGVGPNALFALAAKDKDWFEASAGLAIDAGAVTLSVGADTTIGREDVKNQSYRGSIKFRF